MRKILIAVIICFICRDAFAITLCKRFPTDTPVECYGPENPPTGVAPSNATYITQTSNSTLTNEQALASLATGILKSTTTTGVVSIAAAGTDYQLPYWTLSSTNLYSPITNTVTVGVSTSSYDVFTVNADGILGNGQTIDFTPSGIGGCDSNAVFLGHFNGANGATTSSGTNCDGTGTPTITFVGNAQLTTSSPILGSASLLGDGTGDWVTIPDSASWDIGTDITYTYVDMDIAVNDNTQRFALIDQYQDAGNYNRASYNGVSATDHLIFYAIRGGNDTCIAASWSPTNGVPYNVKLVRTGTTTWTWYANGVALTNDVCSDTSLTDLTALSGVLEIGRSQDIGESFNGKIDEVRVSNSARTTYAFTPGIAPTSEFTSSVATPELILSASGVQTAKFWTDGANGDQLTETVGSTNTSTTTTTNKTLNTTLTLSTKNIITDTTTGTSFGTATTQKTSAYGVTPVVQGGATTDLGTILSNWGLRATGTAYPITTSGTKTFSDLTASRPVITNGSSALASGTYSGNTTELATSTGTKTANAILKWDSSGNATTSGVIFGTLTDTRGCTYTSSGTLLACTTVFPAGTIVGTSDTQTLTNKRITKRVVTASDATSITPNSDNADVTYQANTQALGTLTINADGGTPTNGQSMLIKIKSTNVQTFSWNGVWVGGTNALPTATSGGSNIDYYSFIYDTVDSVWHYTGSATNF